MKFDIETIPTYDANNIVQGARFLHRLFGYSGHLMKGLNNANLVKVDCTFLYGWYNENLSLLFPKVGQGKPFRLHLLW